MIKKFNYLFVTCFFIGTIRFAPGTITSFITSVFLLSLFHIIKLPNAIILSLLGLIFFYSFFAISEYIKDKDIKDPKEVVVDEFIGQSIPIYLFETAHKVEREIIEIIFIYFIFFLLFRLFDIIKIFPANYIDKNFKNSFGVIFDDVIAGFYVVLVLICFMILKIKFF